MSTKQDLRKTLEDVLLDLRDHDPLLEALADANDVTGSEAVNAIRLMHETTDPFEPADGQSFDVVVVFGAATESTTPRNTGKTSTWRIQVNVGAKLDWRKRMDAEPGTFATLEMAEILGHVGDRLDVASGISAAVPEGSDGSPLPLEDEDDGTLTVTKDWIISKTQTTRRY